MAFRKNAVRVTADTNHVLTAGLGLGTTENLFHVFSLDTTFSKDYEKSALYVQCFSDNKRKNLFCLQEINCVGGSRQVAG